ncbi:MAG: SDR family NAD(P)-dependent oxidoreductase [Ilumatobacteraceae bacterium]
MARLTMLDRSVAGKTVIVTGAASGMGRATAHLFADEGANVVVADMGDDRVMRVVGEIISAHGADCVIGVPTDVTSDDHRRALVDATVARFGTVDVLVNNAGISRASSVFADDASFADAWNATLAVNLSAYAHLVRLVVPYMTGRSGRIVNVASTEAIVATPGLAAYSAAKHGVIGLTKSLAAELGRHGINVNAICPGPINTAMTAAIPDDSKTIYAKRKVPLRRYGEPEEVAQMTLSACLPAASFLNGASIVVDGGMTILH